MKMIIDKNICLHKIAITSDSTVISDLIHFICATMCRFTEQQSPVSGAQYDLQPFIHRLNIQRFRS